MNFWIRIGRETFSLTGYRTYEVIETVPRDEGLKKLEGMTILRRFTDPMNASIEVVIVA